MPELPELEALRLTLGPRLAGRRVAEVEVNPARAHLLRYPIERFQHDLPMRSIAGIWRRGKHLGFDLELGGPDDRRSLVINPMLGGRFHLAADGDRVPATHVFSLRLVGGGELRYLDFREMGRIYLASDPSTDVPGWADLGPEADSVAGMAAGEFRRRLRRHRDELKDLLRNQSFLAGIGNAYSDEILFDAGLLPLRRRVTLAPAEEQRLQESIPRVLRTALEAILANPAYTESKQDRSFMRVHARGGDDCPRCGHRISQLGSNREPLNFCRGCQT